MKRIALAFAGASVALTGLVATPASAADFGGHDRGRYEQVQNRQFMQNRDYGQNRGYAQNRDYAQNRFVNNNRGFGQNRFVNNRFMNDRFMNDRVQAPSWQRGERFDRHYAMNYEVIDNPGYYNLRPAPYGYRWVRSGNDAVLVAIASGIIGALMANAF